MRTSSNPSWILPPLRHQEKVDRAFRQEKKWLDTSSQMLTVHSGSLVILAWDLGCREHEEENGLEGLQEPSRKIVVK